MREIRLNAVVPLDLSRETMEKILSIGLFLKKYRVRVQIAVLPTIRSPYILIGDRAIDLEEADIAALIRNLATEIPDIVESVSTPLPEGEPLGFVSAWST